MIPRLVITITVIFAISAASITQQEAARAGSQGAYIALGDSVAHGIGSSLPERRGYPALVRDHLETYFGGRVELMNLAAPGETAESFLENGQYAAFSNAVGTLLEVDTRILAVTLSLGGNEMLARRYAGAVERQQALAEFRDTLDDAVNRVRGEIGPNTTLILTTYYDLSEGDPAAESSDAWWIEQFNQVIRDTAERHGASVAELDPVFRGHVQRLTHAPYDVHPNNQGFRAIAGQVWAVLGFDDDAPIVRIRSSATATRRTPTLQVDVIDNVDVTHVSVAVDGSPPVDMLHTGGGRYVSLLDFRGEERVAHELLVTAVDSAGNTGRAEQRIELDVQ